MEVKKIPVDVQCLLSASAKVKNYSKAVEELVYNSLDAESTCIAIRIHIQNNWIQVVDNGIGIKKADFKLLGERYATSKLFDVNTLRAVPSKYGYQGQALANIIEVSKVVKVTSRCADSKDTWVKTFLEGKIEQECMTGSLRTSKGTTTKINGFLYNLNMQKKYINTLNEIHHIKTFLQQLSLVLNNVSISLRDDVENEIIFKMHKNRDIYQTLKSLFDIDTNDFQELQVEKNQYRIKAFIGVDKTKTKIKNNHWIYLNNKFNTASNLHKIINIKFAKPNCMKRRKVKTTDVYKFIEENSDVYDVVPFYYIFITCPYCEYDIIGFDKQTTIEFKDWLQIRNLIEKLVKFYKGDIQLIDMEKANEKQVLKKGEDTRDEVKKIIKKFLAKPSRIAKVTEMRNGIRGKQARRKIKKRKIYISLTKILPPKSNSPCKNIRYLDTVKLSVIKRVENIGKVNQSHILESKYSGSKEQPKPSKTGISKSKIKKLNQNIFKSALKCKCDKNYGNVIEKSKNKTDSIDNRRTKLPCEIIEYLNVKSREQNINILMPKTEHKSSAMDIQFSALDSKPSNTNKKTITEQIRSYDLLQTVLSPKVFYNEESRNVSMEKTDLQVQTSSKSYYYTPIHTFVSHHYNMDRALIKKKLCTKPHCARSSRYIVNVDTAKHTSNIPIKISKDKKCHDLIKPKYENKVDISESKEYLNRYNHDKPERQFSVDITDNNIIEMSKQIRYQIMNDMKSLFGNENRDKMYSSTSEINFGINLNIEKTYTILVDSFYNSSHAVLTAKNHKTFNNETITYTNVRYHDSTHYDHLYESSKDIDLLDSPQESNINIVEPLDVCEAILHSSENMENYFNNSLNINSWQNSLKEFQNVNELLKDNEINKSHTIISKNKSYPQENTLTIDGIKENYENNGSVKVVNKMLDHITYQNEKFGSNEMYIELNNAAYDFQLNTRHRFVPKGMSQIFKNCQPKNICSYNMDTDYYENTIYNKFVEDIAVNSKIYEPKVQNLKEFATENILKATEKLKKRNADLVFGADSLRSAKVVLGQVDCKFIAATIQDMSHTHKSPKFLVCFDQHAVHERIRLENNLSDYVNEYNWKKSTIETISLKCSKEAVLYLHNHKDKFSRFGLEWTTLNNSEILVNAIPEAIIGKNPRPMDIVIKTVQDLILEQINAIKYLKGNVSLYPQSIMNLVFSEACRYAIKFGDSLSKKDCEELIAALAKCKTPFQCAHGRPVMAVMVELNNKQFEYKVDMDNVMKFKKRTKK